MFLNLLDKLSWVILFNSIYPGFLSVNFRDLTLIIKYHLKNGFYPLNLQD